MHYLNYIIHLPLDQIPSFIYVKLNFAPPHKVHVTIHSERYVFTKIT